MWRMWSKMEGRKEMNPQQEQAYLEDNSTTNYMNPQLFEEFRWGIEHLETFTGDHGRPPMPLMNYLVMIDTQPACGLRIGETISLIKSDFDLRHTFPDNSKKESTR